MDTDIEPITDYLRRRLREAGPAQFDAIAESTGVAVSFIRKFVYGSRPNPRVHTVQPLWNYFHCADQAREGALCDPVGVDDATTQPAELTAQGDAEGLVRHERTVVADPQPVHHHAGVGQ